MCLDSEKLDQIKEFVRANFPEPERVVSPSDSKDLERGYIQISTPLKNKNGSYIGLDDDPGELPWVHYELIDNDNKIRLHLECDGDEEKQAKFYELDEYLKENIKTNTSIKRCEWDEDGMEYYLNGEMSFDDRKVFEKNLKDFMDFFDALICEYNKSIVSK